MTTTACPEPSIRAERMNTMKLADKLALLKEIERRNEERIREYVNRA